MGKHGQKNLLIVKINTMSKNNLIVFNDSFAYLNVTNKATKIFESKLFDLYELRIDEQVESLIETDSELKECLERGAIIGIEIGFLNKQDNNLEP